MKPLFQIDNLSYTPVPESGAPPEAVSKPVLDNVTLTIEEGEFVALIGANGSGKTTLARHLNAIMVPQKGHILVAGMDTHRKENLSAIRRHVGMVFQQPEDQMVSTLVEEEVAFGLENLGYSTSEIQKRVEEALRAVKMWNLRLRHTHTLSAGQMQRVAIAGILAVKPHTIIFDEATAMLDPLGRKTVMEILRQLHRMGITIIFITHFMEEAVEAERVIVLRHGKIALDGKPASVFRDGNIMRSFGLDLPAAGRLANILRTRVPGLPQGLLTIHDLVSALLKFSRPVSTSHEPGKANGSGRTCPEIIRVQNLYHQYISDSNAVEPALDDVSLEIKTGQIFGLIGSTGAGKSTLLQHLNGLLRPQRGHVRVAGFDLEDPRLDIKALRKRIGLAFQNPELYFFEQFVGDEIAFGLRMMGGNDRTSLRSKVQHAMEIVGLDFETYKDRMTFTLSSGEQRKVALASALALDTEILLLDEPTAGLDPQAHQQLLKKIVDLQDEGKTLVLASHQMEDLASVAYEITALHAGRVMVKGTPNSVFSQVGELQVIGLDAPITAQVAQSLRLHGWKIPHKIIQMQELADIILPQDHQPV